MGAARAGVRAGDEVVAIDGVSVVAMSAEGVHRAVIGRVGTTVKLTLRRQGQVLDVLVERGPLQASQL